MITNTARKSTTATTHTQQYWKQHDVKNDGLSRSVASLRQYLSVTVLRRFAIEIDRINKKLDEIGCTDTKVRARCRYVLFEKSCFFEKFFNPEVAWGLSVLSSLRCSLFDTQMLKIQRVVTALFKVAEL